MFNYQGVEKKSLFLCFLCSTEDSKKERKKSSFYLRVSSLRSRKPCQSLPRASFVFSRTLATLSPSSSPHLLSRCRRARLNSVSSSAVSEGHPSWQLHYVRGLAKDVYVLLLSPERAFTVDASTQTGGCEEAHTFRRRPPRLHSSLGEIQVRFPFAYQCSTRLYY